jgi:hypothetical protein
MKKYIVNAWVSKDGKTQRSNFNIYTDKTSENDIKSIISEKCKVDTEKWKFEKDEFKLISKESVIIYEGYWIKKTDE